MGNKVFLFGLIFFAFASSPCYQQGTRGGGIRPESGGGYVPDQVGPPRPFRFSYNNQNDFGGTSYHEAQGDETGTVRGTYGYTDADGLYRVVEYEADSNGYRATVRTNEPGVGQRSPADVIMLVEPVPQAVLNRYSGQGQFSPPPRPSASGVLPVYGPPSPQPPRDRLQAPPPSDTGVSDYRQPVNPPSG